MNTGLNISKIVGSVVVGTPSGINISKVVGSVVVQSINTGLNISKIVGSVVVDEHKLVSSNKQPVICFLGL